MTLVLQAALLVAIALALGRGAVALGLPSLLGMLVGGTVAATLWPSSPEVFDLADVAGPVRLAVLTVVLLRAGVGLSRHDLRAAGPLALRLGLLPVLGDALLATLGAAWLLGLDWPAAAVLGLLVAAISPALVIPGMLELLERRTGPDRRVPTALLAGAPLDNLVAVVGLGVALDLALAGGSSWTATLLELPRRIGGGLLVGVVAGWALSRLGPRLGRPAGWLSTWGIGGALVVAGQAWDLSFVLALLALGFVLRDRLGTQADGLAQGLARVWRVVQVALFGLIGAGGAPAPRGGRGRGAGGIGGGQGGRATVAVLASSGAGLDRRERLACVLGYVPKASIQAAFASLALDRGLPEGPLVLAVAVLAIVVTAPPGVVLMLKGVDRLLPGGSD